MMNQKRKDEILSTLFHHIANGDDAYELFERLGMTANEIDELAGYHNREPEDDVSELDLIDRRANRDDFMNTVYAVLSSDSTNDRANQIIDTFDLLPQADVTDLFRSDDSSLWTALCKLFAERTDENSLYGYDTDGEVIFCPNRESADAVASFLSALFGYTMLVKEADDGYRGYMIYPD